MKKILCILLLLPLFITAQDTLQHRLTGITGGVDICSRFSKADDAVSEMKNEFDSLESGRFGYSAGIVAGFRINERIDLLSGLNFAARGYKIDTLAAAGFVNMKFSYKYIELPVRIVYTLQNGKKIQPLGSIGVAFSYLLQHKTYYELDGSADRNTYNDEQSMSSLNVSLSASLGFRTAIQRGYFFQCEAVVRQSVTALSDTPLRRYLNSGGIGLSLIRAF